MKLNSRTNFFLKKVLLTNIVAAYNLQDSIPHKL